MENQTFTVGTNKVDFLCRECGLHCSIPNVTSNASSYLASCDLAKVTYPPVQTPTEWKFHPNIQATTQTTGPAPRLTVSALARGLASSSLGDRVSTLVSQPSPSRTGFLAPPPPALTHSTSLLVLSLATNPHSSEVVPLTQPQAALQVHHPHQLDSRFPIHTPAPAITSQLPGQQPYPLTISVPPITHSQSTPQLKQNYPPLELSTASVKHQKKERK
jgi:hypothetical protein